MKFENYLTELFTSKIPVDVIWNGKEAYNVVFHADDQKYMVFFTRELLHSGWFENIDTSKLNFEEDTAISWSVSFENFDSLVYTGKSPSAFKVFSGVIAAFKKFLKAKKPTMITFDASAPGLKKIYDRFVPHIEKLGFKRIRGERLSGAAQYVFMKK